MACGLGARQRSGASGAGGDARAAGAGARVVGVDDGRAGNTFVNGVLRADYEQESGACEAVVRGCECRGQDQGTLVVYTFKLKSYHFQNLQFFRNII